MRGPASARSSVEPPSKKIGSRLGTGAGDGVGVGDVALDAEQPLRGAGPAVRDRDPMPVGVQSLGDSLADSPVAAGDQDGPGGGDARALGNHVPTLATRDALDRVVRPPDRPGIGELAKPALHGPATPTPPEHLSIAQDVIEVLPRRIAHGVVLVEGIGPADPDHRHFFYGAALLADRLGGWVNAPQGEPRSP